MAEKMGRDVFIALAAIGWADGTLDADEADAIVRAALDLALPEWGPLQDRSHFALLRHRDNARRWRRD